MRHASHRVISRWRTHPAWYRSVARLALATLPTVSSQLVSSRWDRISFLEVVLKTTALDIAALRGGSTSSCTRLYTPGYSPHPWGCPFGARLRLFKIVPDDFVAVVRLAPPALATVFQQLFSLSGGKQSFYAFFLWRSVSRSKRPLTCRRSCMIGLVVVYWRYCFASGWRYFWIPKAASAASWKPLRISFFLPG
jgi:hypothetical protein